MLSLISGDRGNEDGREGGWQGKGGVSLGGGRLLGVCWRKVSVVLQNVVKRTRHSKGVKPQESLRSQVAC